MAGPLAMTKSEREAYLADLHVGVISIERAGHAPLAVPIWYDYDPAIGVWVITGKDSEMRPERWRTVDYAKLGGG